MTTEANNNNKSKLPFKESHAFIIGINNYQYFPRLKTAINDATELARVLAQEQGFNVPPPLLDAELDDIRELLEKTMPGLIKKEDRCLLYFAGHGLAEESEEIPEGYLIPRDACPQDIASYYSMGNLYAAIGKLNCQHFLLILDCCFAGTFKWSSRNRGAYDLMPKYIFKERFDRFVKDPAWQVITSTACDQKAIDQFRKLPLGIRDVNTSHHSPFAAALFKGLQGEADLIPKGKGDGLITATELYLYLREQVELKTIAVNEFKRQTPGLFPLEKHDKGEFIFFSPNHIFNLPQDPGKNPYKGLEPYEEEDADLFYGREQIVKVLLEKVKGNNLVVVAGASGTGKSSVVKAGLLPELRRQGYHILPVIQPGKSPVYSLEKAFRESNLYNNEFSFDLDKEDLATYLAQHKSILIIDHLEKLIGQSKKEDQNRFIQVLKKLLDADQNNQLKIILTVRSDFEPHFKSSELEPYWQDAGYSFPSITAGELREIIINPIVHMAVEFESTDFVNTLFEDFDKAPGALSLLSFTLNKLYQSYIDRGGTNRILPKTDYDELTNVDNPLYQHATSINLTFADSALRKTLSKIMMRLISIDGDKLVGRKAFLKELEFSDDENERVKYILDRLLEKRLIIIAKEGDQPVYLELAHPILITIWENLEILPKEQDRNRILLQNSLTDAVKTYEEINDENLLWYNDPRLKILRQELTSPDSYLNIHEIKFVEESIKLKELKKKRKKNIIITGITILLISLAFALYEGKQARKKATIARANYLASQAQLRLASDPAAAISLAKDAYRLDQNKNVAQVLGTAAAQTLEHPLYNLNLHHDYYVNSAEFSPSGNKILTASEDNTAKLWDLPGNLLQEFKHENPVTSAVFSPDECTILTVSRDKAARLWNLQGQLLQKFTHEKIVNSAVFSPDGRTILTASDDNTVRLWDPQGELLKIISHRSDVNTARFSPDSTKILTVSRDLNAWLLNIQGNPLKGLYPVNSADFSPRGKYIVSVLLNNTVKLWNLSDNTEKILKGFKRIIFQVAVTPNENSIIIAYLGGAVEMLDFNGQPITSFGLHKDTVTSIVFSPDGAQLLTSSKDRTAKLWKIDGALIADLHLHNGSIQTAVFSPDGGRILTASKDNTARLWDLKDQLTTQAISHREEINYVRISPSGTNIITIAGSNNVQLWDLRGTLKANLNKHTKTVHSAVFSPDSKQILTASADNTAELWDLEGHIITEFNQHKDNVNSAVFSPDGDLVLTASYDGTAKLWDWHGKLRQSFKHQKDVISAVFSPDGKTILTASFDETAKLWDLQGNLLTEFNKQYGQVKAAIFSPDGTKVLTVSASARLWDVNGKHLTELNILKLLEGKMNVEENHFVDTAQFSPDSQSILTIYDDNSARLWNLEGKLLMQLEHRARINSAFFSPDGTRIVTASADNTTKLWDLQGNLWAEFTKYKGNVYSAVFTPDGSSIISVSADKTVKIWRTPDGITQWLQKSCLPSYTLEGNAILNKK